MKTGIKMTELTTEIKRQQVTKLDFIAPTMSITFTGMGEFAALIDMGDGNTNRFTITAHAHNQLAAYLGINKTYYQKMLQNEQGLLAVNLNQWFQRTELPNDHGNANRMVRTVDGKIRAFLSDSYLRIDNYDILIALWPVFQEYPDLDFQSVNITENQMYLKVTSPKNTFEVRKGDIVQAGVSITNSETGMGSFKIQPMTYRLWCLNGCTHEERGDTIKRTHRGSVQGVGVQGFRTFSNPRNSILSEEMLTLMQTSVRNVLSGDWMQKIADKMKHATTIHIADPVKAVEILTKRKMVSDAEGDLILQNYLKYSYNNGETLYGLFNAVTRSSQDSEDYTRATELEALGDTVLDMYHAFA